MSIEKCMSIYDLLQTSEEKVEIETDLLRWAYNMILKAQSQLKAREMSDERSDWEKECGIGLGLE